MHVRAQVREREGFRKGRGIKVHVNLTIVNAVQYITTHIPITSGARISINVNLDSIQ